MQVMMEKNIRDHMHAVDLIIGRKRLFAVAVDNVNELRMTRDAIGMLIMMEEGELKHILLDYLLVTQHTRHALMRDI